MLYVMKYTDRTVQQPARGELLTVTNTLAYYDMELITAMRRFYSIFPPKRCENEIGDHLPRRQFHEATSI
jgi:hypothetical protein